MTDLNRDAELSTLSNVAYMDSPPKVIGAWKRLNISDPSNSGFFADAYINSVTNQVVIYSGPTV